MNIDIIVPYVDENDASWQNDFNLYKEKELKDKKQLDTNRQAFAHERTRDWDNFRFWFRGVEKNCPWVHKVFLVVQRESQLPIWLNKSNPKLRIVYHDEFIPKELLPTFSTLTIETFYYRIPDLSEHFIVCNDDFYFLNPIPQDLFFTEDGRIKQGTSGTRTKNWTCGNRDWESIINNNNKFLEKHILNKQVDTFYHYSHLPDGRVKSFETDFMKKYYDEVYDSLKVSRFRHPKNLIPSLLYIDTMKYTNYGIIDDSIYRNSSYVTITSRTNLYNYKDKQMVCFNDTACVDNFIMCKYNLLSFLDYKLPDTSSFELDLCHNLKKVFGIVSWFPDKEPDRSQRMNRLNQMFNQLKKIFGDVEYLIVAQNWKDYQVPDFVNAKIYKYEKLGILKARKTLGQHFLESDYDYLIMCDDDMVLNYDKDFKKEYFFNEIDKHPLGFMFLQYSWSLNLCAISKYIYSQSPMVDVDPEKGEGYEDTIYPWLLHYKHMDKEFKIHGIWFEQHRSNYVKELKSTWGAKGVDYTTMEKITNFYIERFKRGNFTIDKTKAQKYFKALEYVEHELWVGHMQKNEVEEFLDKFR